MYVYNIYMDVCVYIDDCVRNRVTASRAYRSNLSDSACCGQVVGFPTSLLAVSLAGRSRAGQSGERFAHGSGARVAGP